MKRGLNDSQKQHLLSNCQHADKLLSDVESILSASQSKSVFPKYTGGLTPSQTRVVEVALAFADVALEECTADKMRGYGEVPWKVAPELNSRLGNGLDSTYGTVTVKGTGTGAPPASTMCNGS